MSVYNVTKMTRWCKHVCSQISNSVNSPSWLIKRNRCLLQRISYFKMLCIPTVRPLSHIQSHVWRFSVFLIVSCTEVWFVFTVKRRSECLAVMWCDVRLMRCVSAGFTGWCLCLVLFNFSSFFFFLFSPQCSVFMDVALFTSVALSVLWFFVLFVFEKINKDIYFWTQSTFLADVITTGCWSYLSISVSPSVMYTVYVPTAVTCTIFYLLLWRYRRNTIWWWCFFCFLFFL